MSLNFILHIHMHVTNSYKILTKKLYLYFELADRLVARVKNDRFPKPCTNQWEFLPL